MAPRRIQRRPGGYQTHYWRSAEQRLQLDWFGDTAHGDHAQALATAREHLKHLDRTYGHSLWGQGWRRRSARNASGTVGLGAEWHWRHGVGYPRCIARAGGRTGSQLRFTRYLTKDPERAFLQCLRWRLAFTGEILSDAEQRERWRRFQRYARAKGIPI